MVSRPCPASQASPEAEGRTRQGVVTWDAIITTDKFNDPTYKRTGTDRTNFVEWRQDRKDRQHRHTQIKTRHKMYAKIRKSLQPLSVSKQRLARRNLFAYTHTQKTKNEEEQPSSWKKHEEEMSYKPQCTEEEWKERTSQPHTSSSSTTWAWSTWQRQTQGPQSLRLIFSVRESRDASTQAFWTEVFEHNTSLTDTVALSLCSTVHSSPP